MVQIGGWSVGYPSSSRHSLLVARGLNSFPDLTKLYLRSNHRNEWWLRIVRTNEVRPSLQKIFFRDNDTASEVTRLPSDIKSEIESFLSFQVFYLFPPKMVYGVATLLLKRYREVQQARPNEVDSLFGFKEADILRLQAVMENPPRELFSLFNHDPGNALAADGRIGALREQLLVSNSGVSTSRSCPAEPETDLHISRGTVFTSPHLHNHDENRGRGAKCYTSGYPNAVQKQHPQVHYCPLLAPPAVYASLFTQWYELPTHRIRTGTT